MRCFYVDPSQIRDAQAVLEGEEARHAKSVLRLRPGDEVRLVDGTGMEYTARISGFGPGRVNLSVGARRPAPGRPRMRLDVAQGFLKEKKMDRLVRQLTETGAARFIPFMSARAVARPGGGRVESRRLRWNRIAIEALKQCRRGDLMAVEPVAGLDAVLARRPSVDLGIFFWENAAAPLSAVTWPKAPSGPSSVLIVLGPEGGFSESEAQAAEAQGFHIAGLGPRILRAETAAVVACAVVQYLFGDLGTNQKNLDNPEEVA